MGWFWLFIIAFVGMVVTMAIVDGKEETRLMAQCQADGHKEYECKAILNQGKRSTTYVPIVVPVR